MKRKPHLSHLHHLQSSRPQRAWDTPRRCTPGSEGYPGRCPAPIARAGCSERLNWNSYQIVAAYFNLPTLHVEVYPLADCGRHVVAGDAEVGPHVLAPHPVYLQSVPGPDVQLSARNGSDYKWPPGPRCHLCWWWALRSRILPPPSLRQTIFGVGTPSAWQVSLTVSWHHHHHHNHDWPWPHLVLPGGDVPGGPGHVDVGRDLDAEPGGLRGHGVSVDLTHVQASILQTHWPEHWVSEMDRLRKLSHWLDVQVEGSLKVPTDGDALVVGDDLVSDGLDRLGVRLHPAHLRRRTVSCLMSHTMISAQPHPPCSAQCS